MVSSNAFTTRARSTCRAKRLGWSATGSLGERKYYLSNLAADTNLKTLAAAIKARWVCEQGHQQLKEELGLDHFEGRSWHSLHRHALDDDHLRVPANPPLRRSGRGKKQSPKGRRNRPCQQYVEP